MGRDTLTLQQPSRLAQALGFGHALHGDIAHRDIAAICDKLANDLSSHSAATPGHDCDLAQKVLHATSSHLSLTPIIAALTQIGRTIRRPLS
jgi:hypothetical protein